jgi:hypothetical protein
VAAEFDCRAIVRHQLLFDPRIPYTSKNGSASIWLQPRKLTTVQAAACETLGNQIADIMRGAFVPGSDPGLCVAVDVPAEVTAFGLRCQREVIARSEAVALAERQAIFLRGLGGTNGGMIGATAAVGLAVAANDGRIVQWLGQADDLSGRVLIAAVKMRQVTVRERATGRELDAGWIDVGKHLRPNLVRGEAVLWAERSSIDSGSDEWRALKLV